MGPLLCLATARCHSVTACTAKKGRRRVESGLSASERVSAEDLKAEVLPGAWSCQASCGHSMDRRFRPRWYKGTTRPPFVPGSADDRRRDEAKCLPRPRISAPGSGTGFDSEVAGLAARLAMPKRGLRCSATWICAQRVADRCADLKPEIQWWRRPTPCPIQCTYTLYVLIIHAASALSATHTCAGHISVRRQGAASQPSRSFRPRQAEQRSQTLRCDDGGP